MSIAVVRITGPEHRDHVGSVVAHVGDQLAVVGPQGWDVLFDPTDTTEEVSDGQLLRQAQSNVGNGVLDYGLLAEIVRRGLAEDPGRRERALLEP